MKASTAFFLLSAAFFFTFAAYGQKAMITGQVFEVIQGKDEPVPFASVALLGTTIGTITDGDGKFELRVDAGTYTVITSFVGYISDTTPNVAARAGMAAQMRIKLLTSAQQLEGVKVAGTRITNTESAVLMEMRQANQIMNGISSEMIEKAQDNNAAEVVKRVPGVTLINNSFVMIRGLNPRYNNVLLHNVFAPSMEEDVKSFSFDIVPSGMIDRMLVFKSPSPDLPGDFAGGVVKIFTKSIPDENSWSVSLGTTYRDGSSMRDFLQPERGKLHWTSFNDGYNNLPLGFPADVRRVQNQGEDAINQVGRSLKNTWQPEEVNSLVDRSFSITKATRMEWGKVLVGNITAVNYGNSRTVFDIFRADYNAFDTDRDRSNYIYEFNDRQYANNIRLGVLHNWAFQLNADNLIEFKTLFNQISRAEYTGRTGYHYEFTYAPHNRSFDQVYRGIVTSQVTGNHNLKNERTKVNWTLGYGFSYRDQPDYKRYRADVDTATGDETLYVPFGQAQAFFLGRFYSEMREYSQTGQVAIEHKLGNTDKDHVPVLIAGAFLENKNRTFSARNIGYTRGNILSFDEGLLDVSIDSIFHLDNINTNTGIKIDEQSNPSDSYEADNFLVAGYTGIRMPMGLRWMVNGGVRVEYNMQSLRSASLTGAPLVVENPILSPLPSVNISYSFTDKMLGRVAYGMSLNRPEFRELAPFGFYDFNYNLVKKGSDSIKVPTIHNFDLRWEYYPSRSELVSVAFFYKKFINPIETLFVPGGGSGGIKTFTYGNANMATSLGIEVELRKSMMGLTKSKFVDRFGVMFNGSLIESYVNLGQEQLGQSNERPLQGQSPYIVNAGIFYHDEERKLQVNAVYNVIGPRIFIIGFDAYPDIYEMPRNLLDVNLSYFITKSLELKLAVGDILNQDHVLLQDARGTGSFDRNKSQIIQRFYSGRTYSMGLGMKF